MLEQTGKIELINLLKEILSIPSDFKIRLGMMNPGNTIKILDELIELYKNPKMFKFLHIPVQSGNNEILKKMNRQYPVETFYEIVERFRKEIPEITISTDMIFGFPTETQEQYQDSLNLIKKIQPEVLNRAGYALRPGTIAAKMNQVPHDIIKQRTKEVTSVFKQLIKQKNKKWKGWQGKILIDEKGKDSQWTGRNYCYKPVIVGGNFKLGDELEVKIKETTTFALIADVV